MKNISVNHFESGPVVQKKMPSKDAFNSGGHFVQQSQIVSASLVEGIMGNISVKLY